MKNLLALDLGTKTGYVVGTPDCHVSGVASFATDRFSGGGMRFLKFRRWLDEVQAATPLSEIVFEEVRRHTGTSAAHVYGGLLAMLTAWAEEEEHKVPYEGIPVGIIKRFATGKGNAPKEVVVKAVRGWGYEPEDDNEADALALFRLRCSNDPLA